MVTFIARIDTGVDRWGMKTQMFHDPKIDNHPMLVVR